MTCSIRVLTTSTLDSSPAIVLQSPDGTSILINCGEGCQRSFLESSHNTNNTCMIPCMTDTMDSSRKGGTATTATTTITKKHSSSSSAILSSLKIRNVTCICLTHLGYDTIGGLPGFILTSSDVAKLVSIQTKTQQQQQQQQQQMKPLSTFNTTNEKNKKQKTQNTTKPTATITTMIGYLDIIGPVGIKLFIHSLRHFMKRDDFTLQIHEQHEQDDSSSTRTHPYDTAIKGIVDAATGGRRVIQENKEDNMYNNPLYNKNRIRITAILCTRMIPFESSQQLYPQPQKEEEEEGGDECRSIHESYLTKYKDDKSTTTHNFKNDPTTNTPIPKSLSSLPTMSNISAASSPSSSSSSSSPSCCFCCSYIFQTPSIAGKFIVEKAKQFNIPSGPLYAQLKSGQSITFFNSITNQQETITSQQVVDPGQEGMYIIYLHVPTIHVFEQLQQKMDLQCFFFSSTSNNNNNNNNMKVKVMIHCISKTLFNTHEYRQWILLFGPYVQHITLFPMQQYIGGHEETIDFSPFRSAMMGGFTRSFVSSDIFPNPFLSTMFGNIRSTCNNNNNNDNDWKKETNVSPMKDENMLDMKNTITNTSTVLESKTHELRITMAHSRMEYILIPTNKAGFIPIGDDDNVKYPCGISPSQMESIHSWGESLGIIPPPPSIESSIQSLETDAKLIFLGTGSALPCKHRNVSGIYLQMNPSQSMLLDIGEGSIGQLLRSWKSTACPTENFSEIVFKLLQSIQAVWISHPHADHHLGLLHLLSARNSSLNIETTSVGRQKQHQQPIMVMAPPCIFQFLKEYELIDPSIKGGYIPVNSTDMMYGVPQPMLVDLQTRLGITSCISVPVDHCQHSFALVIHGTPFGQVVYSGDCRPSKRLIQAAQGTDLLIHEATFEDGMEREATLKRHCTIGEAIRVAEEMNAKYLLLTHFSQRYPKIPPLSMHDMNTSSSSTLSSLPIAFAFDYMRLSPGNLFLASKLIDNLRKVYKDETLDTMDSEEDQLLSKIAITEEGLSANDFLETPGAFASIKCLN